MSNPTLPAGIRDHGRRVSHRVCCVAYLFIMTCIALASGAEAASKVEDVKIRGPQIHPGWPDAFDFGYEVAEDSISPDGKYGVIYAKSDVIDTTRARNFLVALNPFRILAVCEGLAYFKPASHRDIAVEWTRDSTVVLVGVGGKWGTIGATLFELREGRVVRRTDIMAAIYRLLDSQFPKGKVPPANDVLNFLLVDEEAWHFAKDGKRIFFAGNASNNPNGSPEKTWTATFKAVWGIPEGRWIERKVTSKTYRQEEQ